MEKAASFAFSQARSNPVSWKEGTRRGREMASFHRAAGEQHITGTQGNQAAYVARPQHQQAVEREHGDGEPGGGERQCPLGPRELMGVFSFWGPLV